jgi:hypothetical protein
VAIELLERALSLECGPDATRDLLLADLAMCLVWSGRAPEAEKICREVLGRGLEVRTEAVFRMCLVQTLISRENTTEALEQAETAMESSTLSEGEQARFRSWAATCRMALGDQQGATTAAEMAKITAERLGDELTLSISWEFLLQSSTSRDASRRGSSWRTGPSRSPTEASARRRTGSRSASSRACCSSTWTSSIGREP